MLRGERRRFRLVYATWLFGVFAFFIPAATWSPASRLALTRALVERGTLSIDAYASSTGDRALVNGQWLSEKAPLPSLVAAAPYAILHDIQRLRGVRPQFHAYTSGQTPAVRLEVNHAFQQALFVCSIATSGLAGVGVGLFAFELLRRRVRARVALLGSVLLAAGTPIFPYATSFYGHTPACALLLGALVALDPRGSLKHVPSQANVRLAGLCLAAAPGCEYMAAAPAALIGCWFLLRSGRRLAQLRDLAAGALVPVAIVAAYHTLAFGLPWRTGYSFIVNPQFKVGQERGLLGITVLRPAAVFGLTFGTSRGLFYIAPVALVGLAYTVRRAVRKDWVAQVGLVGLALLFLMNASYFVWWGGAAAGPRHLIPAIGVLALGLADAFSTRRLTLKILFSVLGIVSVANCIGLTLVGLEAPEFRDALFDFAWPNLLAGHVAILPGASNLGFKLGLGQAGAVLLLLWAGIGYWHLSSLLPRSRNHRRRSEKLATVTVPQPAAAGLHPSVDAVVTNLHDH